MGVWPKGYVTHLQCGQCPWERQAMCCIDLKLPLREDPQGNAGEGEQGLIEWRKTRRCGEFDPTTREWILLEATQSGISEFCKDGA